MIGLKMLIVSSSHLLSNFSTDLYNNVSQWRRETFFSIFEIKIAIK